MWPSDKVTHSNTIEGFGALEKVSEEESLDPSRWESGLRIAGSHWEREIPAETQWAGWGRG